MKTSMRDDVLYRLRIYDDNYGIHQMSLRDGNLDVARAALARRAASSQMS